MSYNTQRINFFIQEVFDIQNKSLNKSLKQYYIHNQYGNDCDYDISIVSIIYPDDAEPNKIYLHFTIKFFSDHNIILNIIITIKKTSPRIAYKFKLFSANDVRCALDENNMDIFNYYNMVIDKFNTLHVQYFIHNQMNESRMSLVYFIHNFIRFMIQYESYYTYTWNSQRQQQNMDKQKMIMKNKVISDNINALIGDMDKMNMDCMEQFNELNQDEFGDCLDIGINGTDEDYDRIDCTGDLNVIEADIEFEQSDEIDKMLYCDESLIINESDTYYNIE